MKHEAIDFLSQKDSGFQTVYRNYGFPPDWTREANFENLIHIILEQQVSLASALAAFNKLKETLNPVTAKGFLKLTDGQLKQAYFSRQKMRYGRALATAITEGSLKLDTLATLSDSEARAELCKITGIGRWTADIFLMMALGRQDIWPKGDVALATAAKDVFGLASRPTQDELEIMADSWRPFRSMAAKLLWHHYLSIRNAKQNT